MFRSVGSEQHLNHLEITNKEEFFPLRFAVSLMKLVTHFRLSRNSADHVRCLTTGRLGLMIAALFRMLNSN